ncbi:MAG: hypothetical protein L0K82_05435, partial [Pisciglobus halotolerans]|nr:hypothetical protein [Pisciglobus halotolerans]
MINDNKAFKKKRTINRIAKLHLFMKLNNVQCYGHIRKSKDGLSQWGYKNINGEDVHNLYKA